MNVLVLGSGGREHALAWKIKQSGSCSNLYCLPGNPGTAGIAHNLGGDIKDFESVKSAVIENKVDLVVVGPEDPLVNGLRDFFAADKSLSSVLFVGPSAAGARLEGSKDYAKEFMLRHSIPTAAYRTFNAGQINEGKAFLKTLQPPYVLKADGLAGGKGVVIPNTLKEAERELEEMLGGKFGKAGNKVVIEEFLHGIEVSVFVLTDGKDYMILPQAKDYKRICDNDMGLNTGGMGAVSPVPFADALFMSKVEERIIKPTVNGLREEGIDYRGFIFIGLMNCGGNPYVVEYNVRMGDPETEAVMTRIDSDLLEHLKAAASGELKNEKITISNKVALTVVCVSGGYPQQFGKGYKIKLPADNDAVIFHSGTAVKEGELVTNGGRVLAVTVNRDNIESARRAVYSTVEKIEYKDIFYRKDIGNDLLEYLQR